MSTREVRIRYTSLSPTSMGASLKSGRFSRANARGELADALNQLALLSAELPEHLAARALSGYASELLARDSDDAEVRENIARLLRAGPGSLSDQYFVHDDGLPDNDRTDRFLGLIEQARELNRSL